MCPCMGPKGPGKNEKISRCSWIFHKKRAVLFLKERNPPIFLVGLNEVVSVLNVLERKAILE
jgi:hypothetical protein